MPISQHESKYITRHTLIAYAVEKDLRSQNSGEFPIVRVMQENSVDPDQLVIHPLPIGHMNKVMTHLMKAVSTEQDSSPSPDLIAQIFTYELIQKLTE